MGSAYLKSVMPQERTREVAFGVARHPHTGVVTISFKKDLAAPDEHVVLDSGNTSDTQHYKLTISVFELNDQRTFNDHVPIETVNYRSRNALIDAIWEPPVKWRIEKW